MPSELAQRRNDENNSSIMVDDKHTPKIIALIASSEEIGNRARSENPIILKSDNGQE